MPFIELVVPTRLIDVRQNLVIKHDCTSLVIRARQELDELPPVFFVFGFEVFTPVIIENINCQVNKLKATTSNMRSTIYYRSINFIARI